MAWWRDDPRKCLSFRSLKVLWNAGCNLRLSHQLWWDSLGGWNCLLASLVSKQVHRVDRPTSDAWRLTRIIHKHFLCTRKTVETLQTVGMFQRRILRNSLVILLTSASSRLWNAREEDSQFLLTYDSWWFWFPFLMLVLLCAISRARGEWERECADNLTFYSTSN